MSQGMQVMRKCTMTAIAETFSSSIARLLSQPLRLSVQLASDPTYHLQMESSAERCGASSVV
jgi:hypothetical protein